MRKSEPRDLMAALQKSLGIEQETGRAIGDGHSDQAHPAPPTVYRAGYWPGNPLHRL